jgi:hypothetical protein
MQAAATTVENKKLAEFVVQKWARDKGIPEEQARGILDVFRKDKGEDNFQKWLRMLAENEA